MKLTSEYDQGFIQAQIRANRITRRGFLGAAAAASGAVSLSLAGCGGDGGSAEGAQAAKKVLRFAQKNPKVGIDPHVINDQYAYALSELVCEAPCMFDEDLNEIPCLLTKMPEVSDDGLTYRLELKDDIVCHDGSKLTAADVKWSAERMMWPETTYKSPYMLNQIEGAPEVFDGTTRECSGITVEDDTHVTIRLSKPYYSFIQILGTQFFDVFPRSAVEKAGSAWGTGTNLVGTGPFKLVENDDATKLVYERFDQYHGTPVHIDELDVEFIDDPTTKMRSYVADSIDLCDVDNSLLEQYQQDETVKTQLHDFSPLGTFFINLNLTVPALQDVRVRQAISLAVNRQELCDTILAGAGTPATCWFNPKVPGHDDALPVLEYNPEKAKQLLADAGYADGITLGCGVRQTEQSVTQAIQAYLSAVGITLNVEVQDSGMWSQRWRNGDLDTTVLSWNIMFPDGDMQMYTYFYSESASAKGSFYNNPEFDQLLLEARGEKDEDRRADLWRQADALLVQRDVATVPLYYPQRLFAAKPYVKDMRVGNMIYHFREVDIDAKA